jgi:hypothetical protein
LVERSLRKMEGAGSSETSVAIFQRNIPEDRDLKMHLRWNLKGPSPILFLYNDWNISSLCMVLPSECVYCTADINSLFVRFRLNPLPFKHLLDATGKQLSHVQRSVLLNVRPETFILLRTDVTTTAILSTRSRAAYISLHRTQHSHLQYCFTSKLPYCCMIFLHSPFGVGCLKSVIFIRIQLSYKYPILSSFAVYSFLFVVEESVSKG